MIYIYSTKGASYLISLHINMINVRDIPLKSTGRGGSTPQEVIFSPPPCDFNISKHPQDLILIEAPHPPCPFLGEK